MAIDAIINQRGGDIVAIYCAIGQRADSVARVIAKLERSGALKQSVVVVAGGEDASGLQYVAPYAATTMAEWFMEAGRDVLIVYDDLTRHARAYRQLSLLLRRPPGREAYPGDIFYIHSRLLERATHLSERRGGGSLTALPIIETQAQNLAAFIPDKPDLNHRWADILIARAISKGATARCRYRQISLACGWPCAASGLPRSCRSPEALLLAIRGT